MNHYSGRVDFFRIGQLYSSQNYPLIDAWKLKDPALSPFPYCGCTAGISALVLLWGCSSEGQSSSSPNIQKHPVSSSFIFQTAILNSVEYYIKMGCNQSACFGPRRRERDVYAQLLDSIHALSKKIQFTNSLNIYSVIHQQINKKGYIKKLLDNLTSHRSKISECLEHNLALTTQSFRMENKYAGLIVLNQIVNNLYHEKRGEMVQAEERTNYRTERTNYKTASSRTKLIADQETSRKNISSDIRADMHFFWMVQHLLEHEGRMYGKVLESIAMFCTGRKEKIATKPEVWKVLQIILHKLQRNSHAEQSASAYLALIQHLKQTTQQSQNKEDIFLAFVRLWLQKHTEGLIDQAAEASLQLTYERILRVLVRRSIASSSPNSIYRTLFTIYDQQKFTGHKTLDTENLLFRLIQQNDLYSSVLKGIFLYMLQYLAVPFVREQGGQNQKRWGSDQFHIGRYPKLMNKNTRISAFETLRRWGQKKYCNLQEYVSFSVTAFMGAYTINLNQQKQYSQQVIKSFIRITEQFKSELAVNFLSVMMEDIEQPSIEQTLRMTLIVLARQLIQSKKLLSCDPGEHFQYFIQVDRSISRECKLQLVQLNNFIAKQLSNGLFVVSDSDNTNFLQNICSFLHSIFENMVSVGGQPRSGKKAEDDQILFRYQLANSTLSFLKIMMEKGAYPLILAYLSSVTDQLEVSLRINKINSYFILFLLYEAMHMLNNRQKIPEKMAALNFRLAPSLKGLQIQPEMDKVVDSMIGARGQSIDKNVTNNHATLIQLRVFTMVTDEEFRQAASYFSDEFRAPKPRGTGILKQNSLIQFRRESVLNSNANSSGNVSRFQEDDSFKDVLDKIKEM